MFARRLALILTVAALAATFSVRASAQFRSEAFSQQYNDDKAASQDSVDVLFSFKDYFGGLSHKNELKIGNSFAGAVVVIGGQQIYNNQTWKLPIVYGTIGGALGTGIALNANGNHDAAKYCFIGAGVAYWATLLDGVICYKPSVYPHSGKATIYSILVPGLGQIYNKEYWKLPLYLGGMVCAYHFYSDNSTNFKRFKNIYAEASTGVEGVPISKEQAKYYRDLYRRYRDYSLLALAAVYVLQIIDANVFSYMHDFEVSDDLAVKVTPAVITPGNELVMNNSMKDTAFGVRFGITF